LALLGVSQAGYWVPRAVAFERGIAAAIVDPGVTDVRADWTAHLPPQLTTLLEGGDQARFDAAVGAATADDPDLAFNLKKGLEPFCTDSPFAVLRELERWTLADVARRIRCPVLITDPDDEPFWPGQSRRLEGAGGHCEPLASTRRDQRIYDWLQDALGGAPDQVTSRAAGRSCLSLSAR
jgi:hypothetical protein